MAIAQSSSATKQSSNVPAAPSDVERRLLETVRQQPDSFEAYRALASFYLRKGKVAAALPHLQRAQAIDPSQYANGYDLALVLLQTPSLTTLPLLLARFVGVEGIVRLGPLAASALLATLPSLLLFTVIQRWLIGGLMSGAVKG